MSRTNRIALVALLIALSVVGSLIKIPLGPLPTVALDALPGYLVALYIGWPEGVLVGAIGHLATEFYSGFPYGALAAVIITVEMGLIMIPVALIGRRSLILAIAMGIILNGLVAPAIFIPIPGFGKAFFVGALVPLIIGALVNVGLAAAVAKALRSRQARR